MRNAGATHNLFAISAASQETAINTFQDVDICMLCDMGDVPQLSPRREDNSDEANGKEEADLIYDNGVTAEFTVNHNRAQPQHFAYLYAYGLGQAAVAAAGAGYQHTITPLPRGIDDERELPSLSLLAGFGEGVLKRRFASLFVDSVTATFAMDDWVKINGKLIGTGKHEDNVVSETVSAAANATTLTLAANALEGSTAADRLDAVHRVQAELTPGVWTDVKATAASDDTPAQITIEAASASTDVVNYKILHVPSESADFTFPSKVVETPMRVAEMTCNFGGSWDGTDFTGGKTMGAEIRSVSHELSNSGKCSFVPGGGGAFASMHERGGRRNVIKFDRKMRDYIMQQHLKDNDTFGLRILCQGAEFDTGHNYEVEIIFPMIAALSAPIGVNDKKLTESIEFVALDSGTYPSVIVRVKNLWTGYAG